MGAASVVTCGLEAKQRAAMPETLLIDADDTLWENNLYFEEVIDRFLELLAPLGIPREELRGRLNTGERKNIRKYGYGVRSFTRSLEDCYLDLAGPNANRTVLKQVAALGQSLDQRPPRIFPGVVETLDYLKPRHRLLLFTKGDLDEQSKKVANSGLAPYFEAVEIVPEKNVATLERIVAHYHTRKSNTWTVGNSPRSDINPALQAGLNAVFIPYGLTWELEKEPIVSGNGHGKLVVVNHFRELTAHF